MLKKLIILGTALLVSSCLFDEAKKKAEEAAADLNTQLKDAARNAEGLLEDPALREEAISELKKAIPDSLWVASNLATEGEDYGEKISLVNQVFAPGTGVESSLKGIRHCLKAIPAKHPDRNNPECYGPALAYKGAEHPDRPTQNGPTGPGDCTGSDCQLPPYDLGIWTEKEGNEACAAAKVNQLTANAAYYTDLAVGSLAAMVCAAGFYGDTIPSNETLDLTEKFKAASGYGVKTAKIQQVAGKFVTEFEGDLGKVGAWIKVEHDPTTRSGLLQIKMSPEDRPNKRAISILYERKDGRLTYRMANAGYSLRGAGPSPDASPDVDALFENPFAADGELKISSSDWTDDLNLLWASQGKDEVAMTYGWQAGSGDGFLRVFNANTAADAGQAWFGYTPHENETMTDIKDLLTIDRMICNWAGPGNQREGKELTQSQQMKLSAGVWVPTISHIHYIPVNACSMDSDPSVVFPSITGSKEHDLVSSSDYLATVKLPLDL